MTIDAAFALFDTPIGRCGAVWSAHGLLGVQLPMTREEQTRTRLAQRFPEAGEAAPPPEAAGAIAAMTKLLEGERIDLNWIALDMTDVPDFNRQVYALARAVPPGETTSYGDIAIRLGDKALSRDVGQALGQNPFPIVVPCHRVMAAGGKAGGFSANGGVETKLKMLSIEKARISDVPSLFDDLPLVARPARSRANAS
jgi:methylated-DNA-[protein]-cysteine S-methyltransferase